MAAGSALPLKLEGLTAAWLESALRARWTSLRVEQLEIVEVIHGTATKVRVRARYGGNVPDAPPEHLCIKGGFVDAMRPIAGNAYVQEAHFFRDVAARVRAPLPRCWYAAPDRAHLQGIVVLDDLVAAGCTFGDPEAAWSPGRVAAGLDVLAQLHGSTWNLSPAEVPMLPVGSPVRSLVPLLLGEAHWKATFSGPRAPVLPTALQDRRRVHDAVLAMWARDDDVRPLSLLHADPHIGNTWLDGAGAPRFLDWQCVCLGQGIDDASYFITGALSVADRRTHERELLRHYLGAFAGAGGPRIGFDDAWRGYRRYTLHGFLWVVTPPMMQPASRVAAMAERHLAAIVDHDALSLR